MRLKLESWGITLTNCSPYTPQSNALAKRMNRILLDEVSRALEPAGLPTWYLGAVVRHAADLQTRTIMKFLKMRTPMAAFLGTIPNNPRFRSFGYAAYPHTLKEMFADNFARRQEIRNYL